MKNFPLYTYSTSNSSELDEFGDITFCFCDNCYTVQLKNLVDPIKLYSVSHNSTFLTPTWSRHHKEFSNFILEDADNHIEIVEIGGSSGILANEIISKHSIPYTIIDICSSNPEIKGITFINTNCETYNFNSKSTLVLSHVFEHLYNPRAFLDNLFKCEVNSIYISIPNMSSWLDSNVLSFLHVEHTFYCDTEILSYLLNVAGYICKSSVKFENHSIFYKFERSNESIKYSVPKHHDILKKFEKYFLNRDLKFKNITLPSELYIYPAGHYGQLTYYNISSKTRVCGFFDNDITKQNKRVYGCEGITFPPEFLLTIKNEITILLCASVYRDEIKRQLYSYNSNIKFIDI